jgi:hypothetical protein
MLAGPIVNRQRLVLVSPPLGEPVTLAEAKLWVGQDLAHHDALLTSLISAARQALEGTYGIAFLPQVWDQYADVWPAPGAHLLRAPIYDVLEVVPVEPGAIEGLWPPPTATVQRVRFAAGYAGALASGVMDFQTGPGRIVRDAGSFVADGFKVDDVVRSNHPNNPGPFTVTAITPLELEIAETPANTEPKQTIISTEASPPEALKTALLTLVAFLYEHRGDGTPIEIPTHVRYLVEPFSVIQRL